MKKVTYLLATTVLVMILTSSNCRKSPKPEPEDLNKHLTGRVYDKVDGEPMKGFKVCLYQWDYPDGSSSQVYKKLQEVHTDNNGNYEMFFTREHNLGYATEMETKAPGYTYEIIPADLSDQDLLKKEIHRDHPVESRGYLKWHVIGDSTNVSCYLQIGGGGERVSHGSEETFWVSFSANVLSKQDYSIKRPDFTYFDTSFTLFYPKHDTVYVTTHF